MRDVCGPAAAWTGMLDVLFNYFKERTKLFIQASFDHLTTFSLFEMALLAGETRVGKKCEYHTSKSNCTHNGGLKVSNDFVCGISHLQIAHLRLPEATIGFQFKSVPVNQTTHHLGYFLGTLHGPTSFMSISSSCAICVQCYRAPDFASILLGRCLDLTANSTVHSSNNLPIVRDRSDSVCLATLVVPNWPENLGILPYLFEFFEPIAWLDAKAIVEIYRFDRLSADTLGKRQVS